MKSIKNQQGMSIVSMLVGVVISIIIMVATFTFFMLVNQLSADVKKDAQYEGDVSLLMLTMQLEIQDSGYQLNKKDHILIEEIAGLNKIYWRYKDPDTNSVVCRSMEEVLVTDSKGKNAIEIQFFKPTNECNSNDALNSMRWDEYEYTAMRFSDRYQSIFKSIAINSTKCTPYMIVSLNGKHQTLEIEINGTVDGLTHELSLCLVNL